MEIRKTNRAVMSLYLLMTAINVVSFIQFDRLRAQQMEAIEKQRTAMVEADRMIAGSKSLTNSVRAFAATGDIQHEKAYWGEVRVIKSRDKAEATLRDMGLTDGEIALIEKAKGNSDKLIELEDLAFKVGAQGNRTKAIDLVFGEDYRKALASIYTPVDQFRERLGKRLEASVAEAERQVHWWWNVSLVLACINAMLVIFILGVFYKRRVLLPLAQISSQVRAMLVDGERTDQPAEPVRLDDAVTEISELAKSFEVLQGIYRKAEDTRWIKTHTAEIGNALQQADSMRSLAQAAISRIAPLVGAGHGALYVADGAESRRLDLLGSYGYRERKHLGNSFLIGEGLVGQAAMEKAPINLSAPQDYIRISSGLGEGPPACVSVVPVIRNEQVLGVLEVASFQAFSERQKTLLDELVPLLAASLEIMDRNRRTSELLSATQEQAERMEKQAAQMEEQSVEMETQQAELLETENWFRSIIEASPDGMLVTDAAGGILLSNPMAESIFGYEPGELIGGQIEQLVPSAARGGHSTKREQFIAAGRSRTMGDGSVLYGVTKDGKEVAVHVTLSPLPPRGTRGKCVSVSVRKM